MPTCQHCLLIVRLVFALGPRERLWGSDFGAGYAARTCLGEQQRKKPWSRLDSVLRVLACSADKPVVPHLRQQVGFSLCGGG